MNAIINLFISVAVLIEIFSVYDVTVSVVVVDCLVRFKNHSLRAIDRGMEAATD